MEQLTSEIFCHSETALALQDRYKRAIALRLRQIKGKKSIRKFCRPLGVNHETMRRYLESGHIPAAVVAVLAREYDVDCNWLLFGEPRI